MRLASGAGSGKAKPLARATPALSPSPVILGFVVVTYTEGRPTALTNSDLMDKDTAEHEAKRWRAHAFAQGSSRKYKVRPVISEEE